MSSLITDAPALFLTYDDDINTPDKQKMFKKLVDFLDIELTEAWLPGDVTKSRDQEYHKLVGDDLRNIIENYDEIARIDEFREYL